MPLLRLRFQHLLGLFIQKLITNNSNLHILEVLILDML